MVYEMYGVDDPKDKDDNPVKRSVVGCYRKFLKKACHRPKTAIVSLVDDDIYKCVSSIKGISVIRTRDMQPGHFAFVRIVRKPIRKLERIPYVE